MVLYWRVSQRQPTRTGSEHGPVLASLSKADDWGLDLNMVLYWRVSQRQMTGTGSEHGPVLASLSRQPTGDWI